MLTIETTADFLPEKEYCFHVLLREMLGVAYQLVVGKGKDYTIRLPNGGTLIVEDHFFQVVSDGNYLNNKYLPQDASPFTYEDAGVTVLFGTPEIERQLQQENPAIRCGVDVFASAFFMLTRWEEYVLPDRDEYGRFPAYASAAVRYHFLDRPVVNEWADLLWGLLGQLDWRQPRPERTFRISVSCDVDHPRLWWSAADRFKTLAGSLFIRNNPKETLFWLKKYVFRSGDPYDVFEEWLDIFEQHGIQAQFNFLGDRPTSSDCYYPIRHPFLQNTIEKIAARGHGIGFHPSFEAFDRPELFEHELESVRQVSPVPVTNGRQHYLRFAAPATWQIWEKSGMAWDSTLGYSEAEGFRCGICHDFPVFDFLERKMLRLREKPLIAMDVTLALYQKYTPAEASERLEQLRRQVVKHKGEFVCLWHNSSWNAYFWADWKEVLLKFIAFE